MLIVRLSLITIFIIDVVCADIDERYQTNANCQACHINISKEWENSRHAHSHFTKNELYNNVLEYILKRNILQTKEEIVIKCAKCHNPRIQKKEVDDTDKIGVLLDINKKKIDDMINTAYMQNGINCIVCHNIDKIKQDDKNFGFDAVVFGPQGVMLGPFKGAKSPYHITEKRGFFKKTPNKLCMMCHLRGFNNKGLKIYSTGEEYNSYKDSNSTRRKVLNCVDCHMGKERKSITSNYEEKDGTIKRLIRSHSFMTIDNSRIYKKYIKIHSKLKNDKVTLKIINNVPHKVPTGYGLREILFETIFYDKDEKIIKRENYIFSIDWLDKYNSSTIPHLSVKMGIDSRLEAGGSKEFVFSIPKQTKLINYRLIYRKVGKNMQNLLNIKDKFFKRDYILINGILEPKDTF